MNRAHFWALAFSALLLASGPAMALTKEEATSEKIPDLRPPIDLMTPTFWERHRSVILLAAALGVIAAGTVIWRLTRPKPVVVIPAETLARQALESWRGKPEDAALVAAVARQVRRFVQAVSKLPPDELTTDELLASLAQTAPDVAGAAVVPWHEALTALLRECETREFAPVTPPPQARLVERALALLEQIDASRSRPEPPVTAPPA